MFHVFLSQREANQSVRERSTSSSPPPPSPRVSFMRPPVRRMVVGHGVVLMWCVCVCVCVCVCERERERACVYYKHPVIPSGVVIDYKGHL